MLLNKRISISYFLRLIWVDVAIISAYAILSSFMDQRAFFKQIVIPLSFPGIVGTLVSLLLAFRTSQSYERWWEARIVWGAIVNDSRTLIRQLLQFLPDTPAARKEVQDFAERQSIWCFALGESLRQSGSSVRVQQYLSHHQVESINVPNALLLAHSTQIAHVSEQFGINPNKQVQLDATLARLTEAMGQCERIKNTIFPKSYSLLIHFLIYVFLTILPFGIENVSLEVEVILSILLPTLFITIERTAILMQDPFENRPTDTPVTKLAQTIENNLREMTGLPPVEQIPYEGAYYVM
ncbi:bestrophin family protein [Flavihumibacter petaseus]|uniref:Uncharacterized protein n=1 Tax=Flavihumibacter petaseus NBRC 106054 TaxID=1220578 RepID=A0A0E9N4X4_9BACT|nr:bestrophin family ion channel [Flavihumibacter petaseus]GAO44858.1 hypothetical protein FPE01S_04_01010 [Flavihumibacter petaseus NBRC 106054]